MSDGTPTETGKRLIHWSGVPEGICYRKDTCADVWSVACGSGTLITYLATADFPGNVTCRVCKAYERRRWRRILSSVARKSLNRC